jgi:hypothetical protein
VSGVVESGEDRLQVFKLKCNRGTLVSIFVKVSSSLVCSPKTGSEGGTPSDSQIIARRSMT